MVALGPPGPWVAAEDRALAFPVEVVAPPVPPPATPARALRVTTFNVEYSTRTSVLCDALHTHPELARSDVLLLQEVGPHAIDGVRAARVAHRLGLGLAYSHHLAILSRWPLRDLAVMELPHARLPYNRRRRIALAATIDVGGARLRLVDVHLDTRLNAGERILQLAPALAGEDPQIVGGDMNTLPLRFAGGAVPIGRADQAGVLDEHVRGLGFATPVSGAGATHCHRLRPRLDAVFTRGFAPAAAQVARDVGISDHFPVWVDLALERG